MRIPIMIVLGVMLATVPARATVIMSADLGELAREAIAIARGRVVAVAPHWSPDHRTIESIVSLQVDAYLKGSLGGVVQFRVPGGTVGRFRSILVGAPRFDVGQQVIVFLGARGPSIPYVIGLSQGVFRIVPSADGRDPLVTPPLLMPVTVSTRVVRGDSGRVPLPLADFERRVRGLIEGAK